MKNAAENRPII
ncbi:hypothetical protein AYI70_g11832, partial [Smittium culicis]